MKRKLTNCNKSGASEWTTEEREAFANDLDIPQLLAVTDNVNQEKSDSGPEEWLPPLGMSLNHSKFVEVYLC